MEDAHVEMPHYRSHKVVEAAPVEFVTTRAVHVRVNGTTHGVNVPDGFFARGTPAPGDYLVRYAPDGYLSWSPRDVFEAGYSPV